MKTTWIIAGAAALGIAGAGLYWSLGPGTSPAAATPTDWTEIEALREGHMRKLVFHSTPREAGTTPFTTADGAPLTLADWQGKHVVVNFWATWCAPCRKEMPSLDRLNQALGGEAFEVVTVATMRNSPEGIAAFFEEIGIETLPQHRDDGGPLAREMGVAGLPMTMILDPQGREIARLRGDAEWDTDSAKAIVAALIDG